MITEVNEFELFRSEYKYTHILEEKKKKKRWGFGKFKINRFFLN